MKAATPAVGILKIFASPAVGACLAARGQESSTAAVAHVVAEVTGLVPMQYDASLHNSKQFLFVLNF